MGDKSGNPTIRRNDVSVFVKEQPGSMESRNFWLVHQNDTLGLTAGRRLHMCNEASWCSQGLDCRAWCTNPRAALPGTIARGRSPEGRWAGAQQLRRQCTRARQRRAAGAHCTRNPEHIRMKMAAYTKMENKHSSNSRMCTECATQAVSKKKRSQTDNGQCGERCIQSSFHSFLNSPGIREEEEEQE